ncbi:hypothetical protein Ctha_0005 [Chloroherpeton thalassium ATCC 35110]|uniref:Outer membrane protein beta-barrel domain-containing protein n=1 Tax=Chloroherpeton thalassium (strain ATCC 35110 / GB-78) TaxID=517418 RepID=B3QRZ2_CHLT3|nr:hypothetical protein [Chloroherpeton thalassium]ACF12477.1 hypothetical protein Ctha_0005 [Chloroherpeton thalassium ATCC 35110]
MLKKQFTKYAKLALALMFCCVVLFENVYAQVSYDTTEVNYFEMHRQFRLEGSLAVGAGFKNLDLFQKYDGDLVTLSAGGGVGGKLSFGYYLTPQFNANIEFGPQYSLLSESLDNADGGFSRTFVLGTLRLMLPISNDASINIGGGIGSYMGGELDIDASKLYGGAHNIYEYKNAVGFHLLTEYEKFLEDGIWSFCIVLKYYNVTYDLDGVSSNGYSFPTEWLSEEVKNQIGELDGSGIDLYVSIIMHL